MRPAANNRSVLTLCGGGLLNRCPCGIAPMLPASGLFTNMAQGAPFEKPTNLKPENETLKVVATMVQTQRSRKTALTKLRFLAAVALPIALGLSKLTWGMGPCIPSVGS